MRKLCFYSRRALTMSLTTPLIAGHLTLGAGAAVATPAATTDPPLELIVEHESQIAEVNWGGHIYGGVVKNNTDEELTVTGFDLGVEKGYCRGQMLRIPAHGETGCYGDSTFSRGAPGDVETYKLWVTATNGRETFRAEDSVKVTTFDVEPDAHFEYSPQPLTGRERQWVRIDIERYTFPSYDPTGTVQSFTSRILGDLTDPRNPRARRVECQQASDCFEVRLPDSAGTYSDELTLTTVDDEGTTNHTTEPLTLTVTPGPHPPSFWTPYAKHWPTSRFGGTSITRWTPTRTLFPASSPACRAQMAWLQEVLVHPVATSGPCRTEQRVLKAATTAVLNEARLGAGYPSSSVSAILTRVNAELRAGDQQQLRRTASLYAAWNGGE